jgi:transposase
MKNTIAGVDLVKDAFRICVFNNNNKVPSNTEMAHHEFLTWLFKSKPMTLMSEACGTSNYWK